MLRFSVFILGGATNANHQQFPYEPSPVTTELAETPLNITRGINKMRVFLRGWRALKQLFRPTLFSLADQTSVNSHNIIVSTYLFHFLYIILHLYVQMLFILTVLDAVMSTSSVPSASYTSTEALYRPKLNKPTIQITCSGIGNKRLTFFSVVKIGIYSEGDRDLPNRIK